ncbi:FAD-dependent oxidoreductase [Micromonospora sp. NPDC049903]|uniref:FAD-dependent oxidoreductase n=1 Tax=Micromonospora sp. NPDC049903 TaxID=3364276 RepID=UPI003791EEBB
MTNTDAGSPTDPTSDVDLIVVGGGVAGLSAAFYWVTEVDRDARVLIVEAGPRIGGPAIQHTFDVDGRRLVSPGGAQELTFPSAFAPAVRSALSTVGVDVDRFHSDTVATHYTDRGAGGHGFAFAASIWGRSHLVAHGPSAAADFADAPIAPRARPEVAALVDEPTDWLAGRTDDEKLAALRGRSCDEVLRDFAALDEDTHRFLRYSTSAQSGMTFDQHPALDAALIGYLGLDGIGVRPGGDPWDGLTRTGARFFPHLDPPIFRFPDGNATVARALAHHLVPDLFDADTVDDRLTAEMSVDALDRPDNQVRIRLNATATALRHDGPDTVLVEVTAAGGATTTYRAHAAVVAAPAHATARLVPELGPDQRATAACLGRYPIVSASVAVRNWRAWQSLGISRLSWPGHPTWQIAGLEFPVTIGACAPSASPDDPTTATALGALTEAGTAPAAGAAAGRRRLRAATARREMAAELRSLLAEALAPGGFVADRDIVDVRVEIWPHGYARYATSRDRPGDGSAATEAKRRLADGVGRIAVAGVDVIDHPFLDGAMESAHLAVVRLAGGGAGR